MTRKEILSWAEETVAKILHPHKHGHKHDSIEIKAYIARDESGRLFLYPTSPTKIDSQWYSIGIIEELDKSSFSSVKWTDAEPKEVTVTIKIDKK